VITGRSDLCIAGVFGAGKTRSLAVLLIALSCEVEEFSAVIFTKENVAAKALADQISDLDPPTRPCFGRLLGQIEEGKGEAFATHIDVRCNDRNRIINDKRVLIATARSTTAELSMRYSTFNQWLAKVWMAFMDESQQYGNCHEIASLTAIRQPARLRRRSPADAWRAAERTSSCRQPTEAPSTATRLTAYGHLIVTTFHRYVCADWLPGSGPMLVRMMTLILL